MNTLLRPWIIWLLLAVLLAGAGAWFATRPVTATQASIITAPVSRNDIEVTVLAQGTLKPRNLVAVGAQASGRITEIAVELGQQVRQGDLIAQIDSVPQTNALRTARAALAAMQAQRAERLASLELARITLERQERLQTGNLSARTEYDAAAAALAGAEAQIAALDAQIEQAEVAIETAEANLAYTRITAPGDGTVLAITAQQGQTVNAAQSAPTIVVLGQLDQMDVYAEISEADIARVSPGQQIWFTVLGDPNRRYQAVLESVAPAPRSIVNDSSLKSDATSSTSGAAIYYDGRFTVPNPDGHLRTYMTAEVHIVLGRAENVLTVPALTLGAPEPDGRYRLQVQEADGRLTERLVTVGLNDKVLVEITEGLAEGERVVTGGGTGASGSTGARRGPPDMGGLPRLGG